MREKDAKLFSLFLLVVNKDVKEKNIEGELFYFLKKESCRGAVIRCWRSCSWCLLVVFYDQRPLFNVGLAGLNNLKMLLIGKTSVSNGTWLKCPSAWQTSIVGFVAALWRKQIKAYFCCAIIATCASISVRWMKPLLLHTALPNLSLGIK